MGRQNPHSQESTSLHLWNYWLSTSPWSVGLAGLFSSCLSSYLMNKQSHSCSWSYGVWSLMRRTMISADLKHPAPHWGALGPVDRSFLLCQQLSPLVPTLHHSPFLEHFSPCCCSKCRCWVPTSVSPHGCLADPSTRSIGIPDTPLISVFGKLTVRSS